MVKLVTANCQLQQLQMRMHAHDQLIVDDDDVEAGHGEGLISCGPFNVDVVVVQ